MTLLNNAQVNLADGGTAPASAAAHGATVLMNNARVRGDLVSGGAFTAKNNARVDGKLYSGSTVTLQNNATVAGGLQPVTPAPHPCECGFDVAARVQDALAHNDDQLLPAGFRGPALVVQNGQSLQLPAGRFAFTSVTVGNNASVTAASGAAVELYVSGAVSVSNNAFLGAAAGQPPLLLVSRTMPSGRCRSTLRRPTSTWATTPRCRVRWSVTTSPCETTSRCASWERSRSHRR